MPNNDELNDARLIQLRDLSQPISHKEVCALVDMVFGLRDEIKQHQDECIKAGMRLAELSKVIDDRTDEVSRLKTEAWGDRQTIKALNEEFAARKQEIVTLKARIESLTDENLTLFNESIGEIE